MLLHDLEGNRFVGEKGNEDFHVFIYWAKFTGKLNDDHVKVWGKQALENKKSNIKVYKVNMDFQEHWGEENLKKINI